MAILRQQGAFIEQLYSSGVVNEAERAAMQVGSFRTASGQLQGSFRTRAGKGGAGRRRGEQGERGQMAVRCEATAAHTHCCAHPSCLPAT